MNCVITRREPVPVQIGTVTLFCESFRAEGSAVVYEQASVSGETVVTNRYKRSSVLTFTGRVCGSAAEVIAALDGLAGSGSTIALSYRDLDFTGCTLRSYSAAEDGDIVSLTVTFITQDSFTLTGGEGQ